MLHPSGSRVIYGLLPASTIATHRRITSTAAPSSTLKESVVDGPVLLSTDQVDRVPWLSMKHPAFRSMQAKLLEGDVRALVKTSEDFQLVFNCEICGKRIVKSISKAAYYNGVVLVSCTQCRNNHLVSDQLGWFNEDGVTTDLRNILKDKMASLETDEARYEGLKKKYPIDIV